MLSVRRRVTCLVGVKVREMGFEILVILQKFRSHGFLLKELSHH